MKHVAKPTGRPSDFYMIGFIITGAIFWALTMIQESHLALYQFLAVVMFSGAIYLLMRYRLTVFTLKIEGTNGADTDIGLAMAEELDLVIIRNRGKDGIPLARLSLDKLDFVDRIPYDSLKERAGSASLFRYQPDMSPDSGILMIFRNDDRDIAIFTELSDEMFRFLKKTASFNQEGLTN